MAKLNSTEITSQITETPGVLLRGYYSDFTINPATTRRGRPSEVSGPSQVNASFLEECDVNNVILRFAGTGELPPRLNAAQAEFLDVSDIPEFHSALNQAHAAQEAFDLLPAHVRAFVNHDPGQLIEAYDYLSRLRASEPDVTVPVTPAPPATPPV